MTAHAKFGALKRRRAGRAAVRKSIGRFRAHQRTIASRWTKALVVSDMAAGARQTLALKSRIEMNIPSDSRSDGDDFLLLT
jgi:hypothetical protein